MAEYRGRSEGYGNNHVVIRHDLQKGTIAEKISQDFWCGCAGEHSKPAVYLHAALVCEDEILAHAQNIPNLKTLRP